MQSAVDLVRRPLGALLRRALKSVVQVATQDPVAALTFDDGPNPEYTPRLLEILGRYEARATFFMVGEAASKHRGIVERVAKSGHAIGNQSWDHPSLPLLNGGERRWQLRACKQALAPYGQHLLRPPFGHQNIQARLDALCMGLKVIMWSIAAEDWLDHDGEWMAERVISQIQPGSIILFHDSLCTMLDKRQADRGPTLQAVNLVLNRLNGHYRFVTIPELLGSGRPQLKSWYASGDPEEMSRLCEPDGTPWRYARRVSRRGGLQTGTGN